MKRLPNIPRNKLREPPRPFYLRMTRDDWEVVIAEILWIFALLMWARFLIDLFKGAQ